VLGGQFRDRDGILGCDDLDDRVAACGFKDHGSMRSMERRWIAPL
jgi:hypothetical protein